MGFTTNSITRLSQSPRQTINFDPLVKISLPFLSLRFPNNGIKVFLLINLDNYEWC